MSGLSLRCIKSAFVYLAFGIGLGAWFAFDRATGAALRPLHAGLNLWGWTTLLIYGMAYHMLPRFAGRPLRWPRLAAWQSSLAILGVAVAASGWVASAIGAPIAQPLVIVGAGLQLIAALIFTLLIGSLLGRRPEPSR